MVYLFLLVLIFIGIYFYDYKKTEAFNKAYWILLCFLFIMVAGLRYRLGADTIMYMGDYKSISPITSISWKEINASRYMPGFVVFMSIFKAFDPTFYSFQIFQALIINGVIFFFFYKNCRHKYIAVLIYFFYLYFILSFEFLREAMAISILLLAWPFFRDGKWIWWYATSFVAILFHISASFMIFLPIICLPGIRQIFTYGKRTLIICVLVLILGFVLQANFFSFFKTLTLINSISERASAYKYNVLGSNTFNINGIIGYLIDYFLYPFIFLSFQIKNSRKMGFDRFNGIIIVSFYILFFSVSINILGRYTDYFFPFSIGVIANNVFKPIILNYKSIRLKFVTWVLILTPMLMIHIYNSFYNPFSNSRLGSYYTRYYPYNSIFNEEKNLERENNIKYLKRRF